MKITKQIIAILIVFSIVYSAQCLQQDEESISQQIRNFGTFTLQHIELISQAKKSTTSTDKKAEGAEKKDETTEKKAEGAEKKAEGAEKKDEGAEKKDQGAEKKDRHQQKKSNNKKQKDETEDKKKEAEKTEAENKEVVKTEAKAEVGAENKEVVKTEAKAEVGATKDKTEAKKQNNTNNTVPFFKGQKIELPLYCKADQATSRLSKPELVSIAQEASKFVGSWNKASGEEAPFNNLKDLDDKKFALFYKEITTGLPEQDSTVKASEAEAESKNLLISVLFGDDKRTSVSWLEFWIYMCSGGIKPSKDQYMKSTKPKTTKNEAVQKTDEKTEEKTEKPAEGAEKPAEGAEANKEARLNKKKNLLKKSSH